MALQDAIGRPADGPVAVSRVRPGDDVKNISFLVTEQATEWATAIFASKPFLRKTSGLYYKDIKKFYDPT